MSALSPTIRLVVMIALAIVIEGKLTHCSWEEGAELARNARTADYLRTGRSLPCERPGHDCDDESGCICRGATIAAPVTLEIGLESVDRAFVPHVELSMIAPVTAAAASADRPHRQPLAGRILRARFASLLI